MNGLLELEGLRRPYGTITALDNLSFGVPAGQVIGFLGPNGAGKTTTMRAIFGLTDLDAGTVLWNGAPGGPCRAPPFWLHAERRGLYPGMLVGEQVEYLGRLHGLSAASATAATDSWLNGFDNGRARGLRRGGNTFPREPTTGAADGGACPRSRAARPRRTAVRTRPTRHRRHRSGAGRPGSGREAA